MIEREERRSCALINLDHPVFDCDGNYYMVNEDSLARMHAVRASIYDVRVPWPGDSGKAENVREGA